MVPFALVLRGMEGERGRGRGRGMGGLQRLEMVRNDAGDLESRARGYFLGRPLFLVGCLEGEKEGKREGS
jgi:hypothetical protein